MRRINSSLKVDFISEKGADNVGRTYFACVPLENMVCYAIAESYDSDNDINSAKLAVESALIAFERNPSIKNIKKYIQYAHDQIVVNSVKNRLEAAIMVVVSDYTRIRYASCGNIKLYLLSENAIYLTNETQTYYQFAANEYGQDKAPLTENKNLLHYLGKSKRPKLFASKKTDLPEECTMFFATCNLWERVESIEILDVYEESKPDTLLSDIQDLLLLTQLKNPAIKSYTLVSVFVEKTYKEDTAKKKKRRRIILLVVAIVLIAAIITVIVISIIHAADRRTINEIRDLDGKGVAYSQLGNYKRAYEQYEAAKEKADKLSTRNGQFKAEKKDLTLRITERYELFSVILNSEELMEQGRYDQALDEYKYMINTVQMNAELEELQLIDMLNSKYSRAEKYIEVYIHIYFGEMYDTYEQYTKALEQFNKADVNVRSLGDLALLKDVMMYIFDVNLKVSEDVNDIVIRKVKELAVEAESELMFGKALEYYDFILELHNILEIKGESLSNAKGDKEKTAQKIELTAQGKKHIEDAKKEIENAEEAELPEEQLAFFDKAKESYEFSLGCFDEAGISKTTEMYENTKRELNQIERSINELKEKLNQTSETPEPAAPIVPDAQSAEVNDGQ